MKILVFGMLADDLGGVVIEIEKAANTEQLTHALLRKFPVLQSRKFMIAVNRIKVSGFAEINDNDEIALIPPFAGG